TAALPQIAIAEFLRKGHYPTHLRRMRRQYQRNREIMGDWIRRYFPPDTRVSQPQGGFTLWVELAEAVDTHALAPVLREHSISIAHGNIFSAAGKYRHGMRLSHATAMTPRIEWAIKTMGDALATF